MPLTLGTTPDQLTVVLLPDSDWSIDLEAKNADGTPYVWPANTHIWLRFTNDSWTTPVEWDAVILSHIVRWQVDSSQVATIPHNSRVRLYVEDTTDALSKMVWAAGVVSKKG